jgi:hypothetical protein
MAHGAPPYGNSAGTPGVAVPVELGQSVVALAGPWKFNIGDDPRWADPRFDDSQWETVDLTPTPQNSLRGVAVPGLVSGWTARGHLGYAGYAWYRMRVRISGANGPLALLAPRYFDSGFQVFVNGHLAGSFGEFSRAVPELYYVNPAMYSLPAQLYAPGPDGTTLLAFRFYMPSLGLQHYGTGGMHMPPAIGMPAAVAAIFGVEWQAEYRRLASALGASIMYFFFALLIATMYAFNRREKVLLWPMAACISAMISTVLIFSTTSHWLSFTQLATLIGVTSASAWYFWMLTWWAYLGLKRKRWLLKTIIVVGIVDLIQSEIILYAFQAGNVSRRMLLARQVLDLLFGVGAISLVLKILVACMGWKNPVQGKRPLYSALGLFALQNLVPFADMLHIRTNWLIFGILFPFGFLCTLAMLFFFSIVLFGQFRASLRRQQATEEDLEQAQEVQRLLISRHAPDVPGWNIESEYRPAREVGGDFFQVLPGNDGSLLVVVGDVSGKGLQAAMTVSAIVGALRDSAQRQPGQVLAHLNRVLFGQTAGFVTCSAALISDCGDVTVANAGHLPPYCNGAELPVPNGLPLGVIPKADYEEEAFDLAPGDHLTFLSDGVIEARDSKGELFGFERMAGLAGKSAAEIADLAQRWGQEDDITVLTVARAPKLEALTV